jgi:DNA-binding CsgD family transcriptional regulator/tetratricopeptide (TPR) repeat protein
MMSTRLPDPSRDAAARLPFVGRERELRQLRDYLDRALDGRGSVALVSGEAGIGKSTLIANLARDAERGGVIVLTGRCYDLTTSRPYGPWLEIFSGLRREREHTSMPDELWSPDPSRGMGSQEEFFATASAFITDTAERQPLLLLLEDIHWADSASLGLLRYVARHISDRRVLLATTYRHDELSRGHPLDELIPHLVRESAAVRVELRRLSVDDVRELARAHYALPNAVCDELAGYLHRRSDGNPFFTVELLRELERDRVLVAGTDGWRLGALEDRPVPLLVRQIIEARLQRLDSPSRRLLENAAVIGQEVPIDLWQAVSGASDDQLIRASEQAIASHLIVESLDGGSLRFTHALVRETLYRSQVVLSRRIQHRAVAEALASQPDPVPEVVAHHFEQASDSRAVEWLVRAGERAHALYATRDAVEYLSRANEMATRHGRECPLGALRVRALAYETLGEFDLARDDHTTIVERARAAGDRQAEWQALLDLGMLWAERDYEQTGRYLRDALDLARGIGDRRTIAISLNRTANWRTNTGQPETAIRLHRDALAMFEELGDREGIADTLDLLGITSFIAGDFPEAAHYLEQSVAAYREIGDRARLSSSLVALAIEGGDLDVSYDVMVAASRNPGDWLQLAEEGLAIAREIGWKAGESFALEMLSGLAAGRGDVGRALRLAEEALAIAQRIGHQQWAAAAAIMLGRLFTELLDPARAVEHLERGETLASATGSHFWSTFATASHALAYTAAGETVRAAELLDTIDDAEKSGRSMAQRMVQFALIEQSLAAGDAMAALEICDRLLEQGQSSAIIKGVPVLLKLRADALARLGRLELAEHAYDDARRAAKLLGLTLVLWRVDTARGRLYETQGQANESRDAFAAAMHEATAVAGTLDDSELRERFLARVRTQIPQAAAEPASPTNAAGLSGRELEVLRLVARGLTDAAVAERLSISPRTVARHLQSVYNKLGVSSRTAAAAFAFEHGLLG